MNIYLLLTEFEVRTISYGPSFFPLAVKFEIVACKIQTVFSTSLCNRNDMKNSLDDVLSKF